MKSEDLVISQVQEKRDKKLPCCIETLINVFTYQKFEFLELDTFSTGNENVMKTLLWIV